MFRIGIKMGPARNKEWTCMFGMHVRTATIIIGLWHLLLNVMVLGLLAVIIRNPEMIRNLEHGGFDDSVDMEAPILPTPLSKIDPPYAYRDHSLNYHNIDMGGLVCVCMIGITLLMIYGAVKGKPSHLLPYFCVQLFDFAITTLTAAGYLCYLRSVHRLIHESHRLPWREELLKMSPQMLSIVVLLAFVCVVMFKAYIIGIVWRCYKYLAMRQHNLRSMLPYIIPDVSTRQERDYTTLLPDYDEAIAQSLKQQPPPSYQVAMAGTTQLPANNNSVPETVAAIPSGATATGTTGSNAISTSAEAANNNNRSAIQDV
ncbi:lysosomal-associated transmembrane protein 4B [Bradysia coprophila]|uniref:lysosomal-associated transmembrane protein 4B n=1 Tax=Bradysia coprophila TaxID=38358 RepID=UPI00187D9711|nr:lysosomal-associated transmembrane protein 4B [Bradysia coprophila]